MQPVGTAEHVALELGIAVGDLEVALSELVLDVEEPAVAVVVDVVEHMRLHRSFVHRLARSWLAVHHCMLARSFAVHCSFAVHRSFAELVGSSELVLHRSSELMLEPVRRIVVHR